MYTDPYSQGYTSTKERLNQSVASDDNELGDDIEDDGEMGLDVGEILRRIYNREANCAKLRKRW